MALALTAVLAIMLWKQHGPATAKNTVEQEAVRPNRTIKISDFYEEYDNHAVVKDCTYNEKGQLIHEDSYCFINGNRESFGETWYLYYDNGVLHVKYYRQDQPPSVEYEGHYDRYGHLMDGELYEDILRIDGIGYDADCEYDSDGNLIQASINEKTYRYEYDTKGRIVRVTSNDSNWLGNKTFSYQSNGDYIIRWEQKETSERIGRLKEEEYSNEGKLLKNRDIYIENGIESVFTDLSYTYDEKGNQTAITGTYWGSEGYSYRLQYRYEYNDDGSVSSKTKQFLDSYDNSTRDLETEFYYYDS